MKSGNRSRGRGRQRRSARYTRATAVVLSQDNEALLLKHYGEDDWALPRAGFGWSSWLRCLAKSLSHRCHFRG